VITGGFLCDSLNPKVPIYFIAPFKAGLSSDLPELMLVGYGAWTVCCNGRGSRLSRRSSHRAIRDRCLGRVTGLIANQPCHRY
jgi:threonine/homoserine/homoserine lactone efflux protein